MSARKGLKRRGGSLLFRPLKLTRRGPTAQRSIREPSDASDASDRSPLPDATSTLNRAPSPSATTDGAGSLAAPSPSTRTTAWVRRTPATRARASGLRLALRGPASASDSPASASAPEDWPANTAEALSDAAPVAAKDVDESKVAPPLPRTWQEASPTTSGVALTSEIACSRLAGLAIERCLCLLRDLTWPPEVEAKLRADHTVLPHAWYCPLPGCGLAGGPRMLGAPYAPLDCDDGHVWFPWSPVVYAPLADGTPGASCDFDGHSAYRFFGPVGFERLQLARVEALRAFLRTSDLVSDERLKLHLDSHPLTKDAQWSIHVEADIRRRMPYIEMCPACAPPANPSAVRMMQATDGKGYSHVAPMMCAAGHAWFPWCTATFASPAGLPQRSAEMFYGSANFHRLERSRLDGLRATVRECEAEHAHHHGL